MLIFKGFAFFSFNLYFNTNPFEGNLAQPLPQRRPGVGYARPTNHAAGGENGSIVVGIFVSCVLASKKSSEREFFVPAGTHLGVKLLNG